MSETILIELVEAVEGLSAINGIDIFAIMISLANLFVLIFTAFYIYKRQVDIMKEQAEIATTQADLMRQQNKIAVYREKYTIYLEVVEFLGMLKCISIAEIVMKNNPNYLKNELYFQMQLFLIRYNKSRFDITKEQWRDSNFLKMNEITVSIESSNQCLSYLPVCKKISFVFAEDTLSKKLEDLIYLSADLYNFELDAKRVVNLKKLTNLTKKFNKIYLPILEEQLKLQNDEK